MRIITTTDGTEIYNKDRAHGQPVVFHHGWPLSGDDNRPGATISEGVRRNWWRRA